MGKRGKFEIYGRDALQCVSIFIALFLCGVCTASEYRIMEEGDTLERNIELEEAVVIAKRENGLKKNALVPIKEVTVSEIRAVDAGNLSDVLEMALPGVEFTLGMNGTPSINMQGLGGKDILFLVDGEKMAGETMDNIDYDRLNMENVAKIEVVKGASSAMYGASAIGGVVNVITKNNYENTASASLNYRTHNELRASGGFSLVSKNRKVLSSTALSYKNRDTYTLQGTDLSSNPVSVWGIRLGSIDEKVRVHFNSKFMADFKGGYYAEEIDKSTYQGYNYIHQGGNGGAKLDYDITKRFNLKGSYYFDRYVKNYKYVDYDMEDKRKYENNRHSAKLLAGYTILHDKGKSIVEAGANYEYEYLLSDQFEMDLSSQIEEELKKQGMEGVEYSYEIVSGTPYKTRRQKSVNSYAQHRYERGVFALCYGVSVDWHSEFGAHLSPNINMKYSLDNGVTFRANYARGVRNPNLKERYMDYDMGGLGMFRIVGNSELVPEKSNNITVSAEYNHKKFDITLNGFYHKKFDCIEGQFNATNDTMKYINVGEVSLYGFDVMAHWQIWKDRLMMQANYTFLKDSYSNVTFTTNRPHSGTARLTYKSKRIRNYRFSASLNGTVKGRNDSESVSYDAVSGEMKTDKMTTYPAYSIWKLTTTHTLGKRQNWEISFGIDNLFNYVPERYDLVSSQSEGTGVFGGVRWKVGN